MNILIIKLTGETKVLILLFTVTEESEEIYSLNLGLHSEVSHTWCKLNSCLGSWQEEGNKDRLIFRGDRYSLADNKFRGRWHWKSAVAKSKPAETQICKLLDSPIGLIHFRPVATFKGLWPFLYPGLLNKLLFGFVSFLPLFLISLCKNTRPFCQQIFSDLCSYPKMEVQVQSCWKNSLSEKPFLSTVCKCTCVIMGSDMRDNHMTFLLSRQFVTGDVV